MKTTHSSPAELFHGDDYYCDVHAWREIGVVQQEPVKMFGELVSLSGVSRKEWRMICSGKKPVVGPTAAYTLRRDGTRISIELGHIEPLAVDEPNFWTVFFTSDAAAAFPFEALDGKEKTAADRQPVPVDPSKAITMAA